MSFALLGDVAEFIRGVTFKPDELVEFGTQNSFVCMRTKNVQKDLDESDLISIPEKCVKNAIRIIKEGDLLVSTANSFELVGKACWVPKLDYPATAGGFISILRANKDVVDPRYLYHWVKTGATQHALRYCGRQTTNISNMDFNRAKKLKIPLPPLGEQKRIAAILDKADAIRRKRQQAIDLTDRLLRSVFLDMFGDPVTNPKGWDKVPLVKIATNDKRAIVDGPFGASLKTEEYVDDGIPVIRINNIRRTGFHNANFKFITEEKYEELIRSKIINDDLLIARVGHTIGKACIFNQDYKALLSTTGVAKVTCETKKMLPNFLETLWSFKNYQAYIMNNVRGAAQPYLNLTTIKAFEVIKPPIELQITFLEIVERIQKTFLSNGKSTKSLDMLFGSLTQKAFRGELRKQTEAA